MNDLLRFSFAEDAKSAAEALSGRAGQARRSLITRNCAGSDYLGWLDLPLSAREELPALTSLADDLRGRISDLVVIGIGGSYLGSRALLEALAQPGERGGLRLPGGPEIHFAGQHLGGRSLDGLIRRLRGRDFALNVISKSGTTLEPSVAFRLLRAELEAARGREAARFIVATTDPERGALRKMADGGGWASLSIPPDVGGRFSVLSPVGLFPLAVAGLDIEALLDGAAAERKRFFDEDSASGNPALRYAALRQYFHDTGLKVELLGSFEPELSRLGDWWAQLFGESEGKEGRGIFPVGAAFTTDLHSLGQYLQDGTGQVFETLLRVARPPEGPAVPRREDDLEGLNELAGRPMAEINRAAEEGTLRAHRSGGMPVLEVEIPEITEAALGGLIWFFEATCAVSALMLGVNPFDQPGVEAYKREMQRLLKA